MAASLEELQDRLAIRELAERYSSSITTRDWDAVAACFHPQGRWRTSPPFNHDLQGRAAIREGIAATVSPMDFLVQMSHSVVIDRYAPDQAATTVVVNEVGRVSAARAGVFVLGVYTDRLSKVDGVWAFDERFFQGHYLDGAWLPGQVLVEHPGG